MASLTPTRALRFIACMVVAGFGAPAAAAAASPKEPQYYVSLGDSYGAGYQPTVSALRGKDSNGFAYQLIPLAKRKGDDFVLRNFACDGATTATAVQQEGCQLFSPGPSTATYSGLTQAAAAEQFMARHRGHIGLITVSLGGNDVLGCTSPATLVACVTNALTGIRSNMAGLLAGLRQAAGPGVPIIGTTYPDVFLGRYVSPDPLQRDLAVESVPVFENMLNPTLQAAYVAVGARFVDVTAATGGYTPFSQTTATSQYGTIPTAVADVCSLTYYCRQQDVHPTRAGYAVIARLIARSLTRHGPHRRSTHGQP